MHAIHNLSDNPFPPQSMTLTGREGWRLRLLNYRVTYTVSGGDITLFLVKVAHRKKITNNFLKNEANIAARREVHDKASYQLLNLAEVAFGFAVGFSLTLI